MSGMIYREPHIVRSYECDLKDEMSLPALINVMVEISGLQSEYLGNTEDEMMKHGLSWIIIQYNGTVNRMPRRNERITIETEAISYNRFFTYRAFRAFDEAENILVEVMTTFSTMNRETRKMTRIKPELVAPYQAEEMRSMMRFSKIEKVEEDTMFEQPFRVRYLDIDSNRHVNNSKYFDWMLNSIDVQLLSTYNLKTFNIKYEKEVEYGNMVDSRTSITPLNENRVQTNHEIKNGDSLVCVANFVWEKVE